MECGGRAPHSKEAHIVTRFLASIAKFVATLVSRFTALAGDSSPVLDCTESGTGRLRLRLSTS